jgi:cytochrome c-type biogenesis protein CcmE
LGGLVEDGSVVRSDDAEVKFRVTDMANTVSVTYKGILPDLFREGRAS